MPFFQDYLKGPDVTRPRRLEGAALRNLIGKAMKFPTTSKAAEEGDESKDWYMDVPEGLSLGHCQNNCKAPTLDEELRTIMRH